MPDPSYVPVEAENGPSGRDRRRLTPSMNFPTNTAIKKAKSNHSADASRMHFTAPPGSCKSSALLCIWTGLRGVKRMAHQDFPERKQARGVRTADLLFHSCFISLQILDEPFRFTFWKDGPAADFCGPDFSALPLPVDPRALRWWQ